MSRGKSPETVLADFKKFVSAVHAKLPEARVSFITIKPSLSRWKLSGKMSQANGMVRDFCKTDNRLGYIDIWQPMLGDDGKPLRGLFVGDGLHLNAKGYAVWTKVVEPHLADR
jgi:lysophospholipase L1-like esterase